MKGRTKQLLAEVPLFSACTDRDLSKIAGPSRSPSPLART